MNLLHLPPGKKRFWTAAALAATAVAGMAALEVSGLAIVRRDARVLAGARRELALREEQQRDLIAAGRILNRLEPERSLLATSFADPAEPLAFIETIERLARRFGGRVELRLTGEENRADAYDIVLDGPFPGALAFLEHLESLPYLVELGEADLRRGEGAGREATVRLTIGLRLVSAPSSR